jgi:serine/threonine-protein kinase
MPAAGRDLLFGLLALQNGLIDQIQLVAAFQAWTRDKVRPLAEHLVVRGDLDPDARAGLDAMVALHLKKHGGDPEMSLVSIPVGRSTRECLAAVAAPEDSATVSHLGSGSTEPDAESSSTFTVGTSTADGQRFRVLRPHAQGGLGAVFVALDAELNREVALKQILDHHADDPVSRQRFLVEAEITGGLEHPGIVPVYGLGTHLDGRPFYAMRFIRGDSLKEAVERFHRDPAARADPGARSLELRKLLRRYTDVCNAIDYAHSRGVLHRDIKPGNIIVGKHGETLVVDWGLAKPLGRTEPSHEAAERTLMPSSASGSAETLPGQAIGTPAYMSPEQARGDLEALGPRSDVYSLGATLYSLLTGQPPFAGNLGDVLSAVLNGDFRPPRTVDPAVDPALEAICLKAMALRPEDRYTSCRALAEDIERWMADEPVTAWREPLGRRVRRWANRNRTAVASAAVAVFASLVGLGAVAFVQAHANVALETKNGELSAANARVRQANAKVEARYNLAVEAIKTFHTGVSEDFLLKQYELKELRDRLLKSASDFYGKLSALLGEERDFASRRALAASNFELADLTVKVGRLDEALAAHRAVLAAREVLASEPGAGAAAKVDAGLSLTDVAALLQVTGKPDEALASYRRAEALLAGLVGSEPSARPVLADCRSRLGDLLTATGRIDSALATLKQARVDQEALSAGPRATRNARLDLSVTVNRIGSLLGQTGKPVEAEAEYRAAMEIRRKLVADYPDVAEYRNALANGHFNLALLLADTGRIPASEAEYRRALALWEDLAAAAPAVTAFRARLADCHHALAILMARTGQHAKAETEFVAARALQQKLADDNPNATDFRNRLATTHGNLGILLLQRGRLPEAEKAYHAALAIHSKLAADNPEVTEFRNRLAEGHNSLGVLLASTGKPAEGEAEFRAALAIQQKLADDHPVVTDFRSRLADTHGYLGVLLRQIGKPVDAADEYRRALGLQQKLADENPAVTDFRSQLSVTRGDLGILLAQISQSTEAEAEFRQAIGLLQTLADANPGVIEYRTRLAGNRGNLAALLEQTGRPSESESEYRAALTILKTLADEHPTMSELRSRLAENQNGLGALLAKAGKPSEAEAQFQSALAIRQKLAEDEPANPVWRGTVGATLNNLGHLAVQTQHFDTAVARFGESLALHERLIQEYPTMADLRDGLAHAQNGLGRAHFHARRFADAMGPLRKAIALWEASSKIEPATQFRLACTHALMSQVAANTRPGLAATEADRAMAALERAVSAGYRDPKMFATESDLEPVRQRDDFRRLMLDLAMPADAFAKDH